MSIRERLSGNEAAATAMKQINPDVVAAFPITPSTEIPQYFSTFVSNGAVDTEFVAVESEHRFYEPLISYHMLLDYFLRITLSIQHHEHPLHQSDHCGYLMVQIQHDLQVTLL